MMRTVQFLASAEKHVCVSKAPTGSSSPLLVLAPPGLFWLFLAPPGSPSLLLAPPCSSWLLLALLAPPRPGFRHVRATVAVFTVTCTPTRGAYIVCCNCMSRESSSHRSIAHHNTAQFMTYLSNHSLLYYFTNCLRHCSCTFVYLINQTKAKPNNPVYRQPTRN